MSAKPHSFSCQCAACVREMDGRFALQIVPGLLMSGVLLLMAALSVGCASLPAPAANSEIAWQLLNVVDTGQTITVARNPDDYMEGDPFARQVIGAHPNEKSVYLFMAATAVAHYGVSAALESLDEAHPGYGWGKCLNVWESVSLGVKGFYVAHNNKIGLKPWASDRQ
jgi:hypothetical protein